MKVEACIIWHFVPCCAFPNHLVLGAEFQIISGFFSKIFDYF